MIWPASPQGSLTVACTTPDGTHGAGDERTQGRLCRPRSVSLRYTRDACEAPSCQHHAAPRQVRTHVRLTPAMEAYYATLGRLRPDSVGWLDAEGDPLDEAAPGLEGSEDSTGDRFAVRTLERLERLLDE